MRKPIPIACLLAALVVAGACSDNDVTGPRYTIVDGSGVVVEQARAISGVTEVNLATIGSVFIEQGASEALRVRADDNLLPYIETDVSGGVLLIWVQGLVNLRPTEPIEIYLTVTTLDSAVVSGIGRIESSAMSTDRLELLTTGIGTILCDGLDAQSLDVRISGIGNVTVSGTVDRQDVGISGAGNYMGRDLESAEAGVLISATGSAWVRVRDRLDVTISGAGSVYYIGDPQLDVRIMGTGEVKKIG